LSRERLKAGDGDDGAVWGVFEEESGGEVGLQKSVERGGCGGRDGDVSFQTGFVEEVGL